MFKLFLLVLAGLASLAAASVPALDTNSTLNPRVHGDVPNEDSIMAKLEGLPGCYAQCFVKHRKKWHTDMGKFTFQGYCGYYWKSALLWEWVYVRGCALGACNENGIFYEGPDYYDRLPTWIHQARRQWLIGHCRGIRDIENYHEKHASGPEWTDSW